MTVTCDAVYVDSRRVLYRLMRTTDYRMKERIEGKEMKTKMIFDNVVLDVMR